jgi:hypothetical protein
MLPIISLTFLHMLVRFTQEEKKLTNTEDPNQNKPEEMVQVENKEEPAIVDTKDIIDEVSRVRLSEEDLGVLEGILNKLDKKSEIPNEPIKEEDIEKKWEDSGILEELNPMKENSSLSEFFQSNDIQKIIETDDGDVREENVSVVTTPEVENEKQPINTTPNEDTTPVNQQPNISNEMEKKN